MWEKASQATRYLPVRLTDGLRSSTRRAEARAMRGDAGAFIAPDPSVPVQHAIVDGARSSASLYLDHP
jgi:hypothetical protein